MTKTFTASVEVAAPQDELFAYFVDAKLMVTWIGDHAVLDAQPGGEFTLDIQGIPVRGRYVEVEPHTRVVVSWGHAGSATFPAASTEVEFTLTPITSDRTLVSVEHRGLPVEQVHPHSQGWPMFLDRLAALRHEKRA